LMEWHQARPGDTFFIPAGTVHAIGAGLTLCEIQQHSDVTYRLYDYGRPRELHLEEGVRVSDLGSHAARQTAREELLVSCRFFTTEKCRIDGRRVFAAMPGGQTLILLDGEIEIGKQRFRTGDAVQALAAEPVDLSGQASLLRTYTA